MPINKMNYQSALQDFNDARLKASLQEALARLTGKPNELLSYDEVAQKLKLRVRSDRGIHDIPVESIVGSVGRYTDFTRTFLPRKLGNQERWARVKAVMDDPVGAGMEPIEVYKVGEAYFVLDGNHRVSIARQEGFEFIEAHIIEVKTDVPVTPDLQPDDLIIKAEYADFLEKTDIRSLFPNVDLSVSMQNYWPILKSIVTLWVWIFNAIFPIRKRSSIGTTKSIFPLSNLCANAVCCAGFLTALKQIFICGFLST
jgi:hypothetical protein